MGVLTSGSASQMRIRGKRDIMHNNNTKDKRRSYPGWGNTETTMKRRRPIYKAPKFKHSFLVRNLGKPVFDSSTGQENSQVQHEILELDDWAFVRMRVEWRVDNKCPFCSVQARSRDRLIKHLHRFHRDHHSFTVVKQESGTIKIHAKPTKPYRRQSRSEVDKPLPKEAHLKGEEFQFIRQRTGGGRKRKRERVEPWLPEGWTPKYSGDFQDSWDMPKTYSENPKNANHKRRRKQTEPKWPRQQYYHSRSRIPMRVDDWDVDSDDGSDDEWVHQYAQGGLHEFLDVKDNEKVVLNLWNRYIRSEAFISDRDFVERIKEFMSLHANHLKEHRVQMSMLLTTLAEQRLIAPKDIHSCMKYYVKTVVGGLHGKKLAAKMLKSTGDVISSRNTQDSVKAAQPTVGASNYRNAKIMVQAAKPPFVSSHQSTNNVANAVEPNDETTATI